MSYYPSMEPNGGASYHNRPNYSYIGRERGRGSGGSQPVVKFTEEFDFNAMNEKFNKDEVWGSLGKSKEKDGNASDEDEPKEENDHNLPKVDAKTFGEFSRYRGGGRGRRGPYRGRRTRGGYYGRGYGYVGRGRGMRYPNPNANANATHDY